MLTDVDVMKICIICDWVMGDGVKAQRNFANYEQSIATACKHFDFWSVANQGRSRNDLIILV